MGIITALYGGRTRRAGTATQLAAGLTVMSGGGEAASLSRYAGVPFLVVNTASQCGFTRQYDALEELYQRYKERGLVVLGFPSNDFAGQEPGTDAQISEFCRINHGVTFPLFAKGPVTGPSKQPLFRWLTEGGPTDLRGEVRWNFEKFLVGRDGKLAGRWRPWVSPLSRSIRAAVERELG